MPAMDRAERRRQLRQEEKALARGLDPRSLDRADMIALLRTLDQKVRTSVQRRSVTPLMEYLFAAMRGSARSLGDVPVACARGCSHCCHNWVDAGPAEVLFAVGTMSPGQRTRAREAVEQACGRTGGLSFGERTETMTACPLLENHACTIYETRPVVCRAAASANAQVCRRAYLDRSGEGVPVPTVWRSLGLAYAAALEGAILHSGLVPTAREWNESLRLAMDSPDAEPRWLAGEDVFRDAPRASTAGSFEHPQWAQLYREAMDAFEGRSGEIDARRARSLFLRAARKGHGT